MHTHLKHALLLDYIHPLWDANILITGNIGATSGDGGGELNLETPKRDRVHGASMIDNPDIIFMIAQLHLGDRLAIVTEQLHSARRKI